MTPCALVVLLGVNWLKNEKNYLIQILRLKKIYLREISASQSEFNKKEYPYFQWRDKNKNEKQHYIEIFNLTSCTSLILLFLFLFPFYLLIHWNDKHYINIVKQKFSEVYILKNMDEKSRNQCKNRRDLFEFIQPFLIFRLPFPMCIFLLFWRVSRGGFESSYRPVRPTSHL